jgi:hypothetical protein
MKMSLDMVRKFTLPVGLFLYDGYHLGYWGRRYHDDCSRAGQRWEREHWERPPCRATT